MRQVMLILVAALCLSGCAGGRGFVRTKNTTIPISFSSAIPDAQGRPLRLGQELEKVGTFRHVTNSFGFIYYATPMDVDVSKAVNRQVEAAGGEGIVNFSVGVDDCALNYFFPLNHLPFWPGCARFRLDGIIVQRLRK